MGVLEDAARVVAKYDSMKQAGAQTVQTAVDGGLEVAAQVSVFAEGYPGWVADGGLEETGHISFYPKTNMAYLCYNAIQRYEQYAPDIATNNYNPYPQADADGVYPYVYGMTVWPDMRVRDNRGIIYRCILANGTYKLMYEPSEVPSIFEID